MIGVLVSGEGSNLQALLDAGLPVSAVASTVSPFRYVNFLDDWIGERPCASTSL